MIVVGGKNLCVVKHRSKCWGLIVCLIKDLSQIHIQIEYNYTLVHKFTHVHICSGDNLKGHLSLAWLVTLTTRTVPSSWVVMVIWRKGQSFFKKGDIQYKRIEILNSDKKWVKRRRTL